MLWEGRIYTHQRKQSGAAVTRINSEIADLARNQIEITAGNHAGNRVYPVLLKCHLEVLWRDQHGILSGKSPQVINLKLRHTIDGRSEPDANRTGQVAIHHGQSTK